MRKSSGELFLAALLCAIGTRALADYQPDIMICSPGDTFFRGEGVYYTTRINQTRTRTIAAGSTAVYLIRVRNAGTASDEFLVTGPVGDSDWTIRYYDAPTGGTDITDLVAGSGWPTGALDAGQYADIRAEVTPSADTMQSTQRSLHVFAASLADVTKSDMVKAVTWTARGDTYYISPSGSNSNPGTFEQPWASPGYASRQLQPGDTLVLLGGRYVISQFDQDIIVPQTGTASAPITIMGLDGTMPTIAGRDNLFSAAILGGRSYITLRNLEITHDATVAAPQLYFRTGISISGQPSQDILLQNLWIHHIDEGALDIQDVENIWVVNCTFEYCGFGGIGGPAGAHGGCRNVLVRGCELSYSGHYDQGGDGHDRPYDRPDGYGIEPSDGPIEICDTLAQHNCGDGLDSKSANTYIHNCIVANSSCDGIKLWQGGSRIVNCLVYGTGDGVGGASPWAGIVIGDAANPNAQFEVTNITVHDNPSRHAYPFYVQYDSGNPISLVMRNNIIANGYGAVYVGPSVNLACEYNLFYRPGDAVQVEARGRTYTAAQLLDLGPGNIYGLPLFVHPAWGATGDYHLLAGSPGIDVGTATGAPHFDLDYVIRPQGAGYDMGSYER